MDNNLWSDPDNANLKLKEQKKLKKELSHFVALEKECDDLADLSTIIDERDGSMLKELNEKIETLFNQVSQFEILKLLSGKHDPNNAIVSINAGAGGTESCDWTNILLRMYLKWCERKSFVSEIIDILPGDEAGVKNVTFSVTGEFAYGYLKCEVGIHRLVRISPFDSNKRRHTSFASVAVLPEIDETIDIQINDVDLRVDTYRSSGAGGQHVNKTDSAVRLTHLPTGIVVACQNERSQHKNRAMAMKILTSKLYELKEKEELAKKEKLAGEKKDISWGSQIRSYVLQPYQLIKDHRTNVESGNVSAVLDGDLDAFIEGFLKVR